MCLVPEARWPGQRPRDCPSAAKTRPQGRVWDSRDFSPFGNAMRLTSERQETIFPAVSSLLRRSGPSHVARSVTQAVVDAVERVHSRRAMPNISQECFKTLPPALANSDPSTTILRIGRVLKIQAPPLYPEPYAVFNTATSAVRGFCGAAADARTVFTVPTNELTKWNHADCSASSTGDQRSLTGEARKSGRIELHRVPPELGVIPPAVSAARGLSYCTAHEAGGTCA